MELIYKYSSWNKPNETFRDNILLENSIWLASALSFNDPFDSCLPIRYENDYQGSTHFYRDYLNKYYEKKGLVIKREILDIKAEELLSSNKNEFSDAIETAFKEFIYNSVGISCFSKKPDNILMWAHYGDCHKGICLGYDANRLQNDLGYNLLKINYQTEFYQFQKFGEPQEVQRYLLSKFVDWEYEDEYRIIMQDSANVAIPYNKSSLSEVIIGIKMPKKERESLTTYLKENYPHAQIKNAQRNATKFLIDLI